MRVKDAELLIGKLVKFYCHNAYYTGELISIEHSKPFRANVKIKNLISHPDFYGHNSRGTFTTFPIKIHKENVIINVGNGIEIYVGEILSYKESVLNSLKKYLLKVEQHEKYYSSDKNFSSCYICSLNDSVKLKNIISKRIYDVENNIEQFYFEEEH
jgi:hypothetical protein